jgi:hypothetical protein
MEVQTVNQPPIEVDTPIVLHKRQSKAIIANADEILFGGAAGGGKSYLLRAAAINWCSTIPGLMCYLFRRQYPDLLSNHMEGPSSFRALLAPVVARGEARILQIEVQFQNGSRIFLRHCANENDVLNYQGAEIHLLLIDELTHFTETIYRFLRSRVRLGNFIVQPARYAHLFPRTLCASNPGGPGHHWVKQTWVDHGRDVIWQSPEGTRRLFIPATVDDNPTLLAHDPFYLKRLEGLGDPALVKAMRYADWDVVAGSMFGDKWNYQRHVVKPFPIPGNWDIWRGGDDGYAAPASIHWITQNPDTGTFYVIDEIYKTELLPQQLAVRILKKDKNIRVTWGFDLIERNEEQLTGDMDSAAFSDIGTGRPSRADQMNEHGCLWRPVEKGAGSRVMRCQMMHQALSPNPLEEKDENGEHWPGIRFFSHCTEAIRTIPALAVSERDPEDVDQDGETHAFDSITYGMSRKKRFFIDDKVYGI